MEGYYEVSSGLLEAFPTIGLQREAHRKIYRRIQGIYRRYAGGLQEDAKSSFEGFKCLRVGGKGR